MSLYDLEDEQTGWLGGIWNSLWGAWEWWNAPDPAKVPFAASTLRARVNLCLARIQLLRLKYEVLKKEQLKEVTSLAQAENALAEAKALEHLLNVKRLAVFDALEPHLVLLKDTAYLPSHDMSAMLSVHTLLYAYERLHELRELGAIRQQLLMKHSGPMSIVKVALSDQQCVSVIDEPVDRVKVLTLLNSLAPGKNWVRLLIEATLETSKPQVQPPPAITEELEALIASGPIYSSGEFPSGPGSFGGSGNSQPPTDSPVAPLEVSDFPSVPLYPTLQLSGSLEHSETRQREMLSN